MAGDRVRVPVDVPAGVDEPAAADGRVGAHRPGALPVERPAVAQNWDSLRPALRERLSGVLGAVLMWWRDDDDPFRTRVSAFGERGMCRAEPATRDGRPGHRVGPRAWLPGSLADRRFRGPGPGLDDPGSAGREHTGGVPTSGLVLAPEVSALLGHLPTPAQEYLQVPLLNDGGAAEGERWYQIWDGPEQTMDAWLWLRAGRAVTFAQGRRVRRGGEPAHWELHCWRATCA